MKENEKLNISKSLENEKLNHSESLENIEEY